MGLNPKQQFPSKFFWEATPYFETYIVSKCTHVQPWKSAETPRRYGAPKCQKKN